MIKYSAVMKGNYRLVLSYFVVDTHMTRQLGPTYNEITSAVITSLSILPNGSLLRLGSSSSHKHCSSTRFTKAWSMWTPINTKHCFLATSAQSSLCVWLWSWSWCHWPPLSKRKTLPKYFVSKYQVPKNRFELTCMRPYPLMLWTIGQPHESLWSNDTLKLATHQRFV